MAQKQKQVSFFKKWTPNRVYTESFLNSVLKYLNIQDKKYFFISGENFNYKDFIDLGYNRYTDYSSKDVGDIMIDVLHNISLESHMLTLVEAIALVLTNLKINYKYAGGIYFNGVLPVETLYKGYCNLQNFFNKYDLPYMVPNLTYKEFLNNLKDESAFYEVFIRSKADRNKNSDCVVPTEFNWRSAFDTHGLCKVTRDTQVPFFTLRAINDFYFVVIDNDTVYGNRIFSQLESFAKIIFNCLGTTHNYDYSLFITNCKSLVTKTDMLKSISKISIGKVCDSIYLMENQRNNEDCEDYYDELKVLIEKQRRNIFTPEINYRVMVAINEIANRCNYKFRFRNYNIKPQIKEKDVWDEVKEFKPDIKESEERSMIGINKGKEEKKSEKNSEQKKYINKSLGELDKSIVLMSSTIKSLKGSLDKLEDTLSSIKGRCDVLEEEFKKKYGESALKELYERNNTDETDEEYDVF